MAKTMTYDGCMAECCTTSCHCGEPQQWYDEDSHTTMMAFAFESEWEEFAEEFGASPTHFGCALRYASLPAAFMQNFVKRIGKDQVLADMWAFNHRCAS